MSINTSAITGRRTLHFDSLDEVYADAERIISSPYRTLGNWNAAQIFDHLAIAMNSCFDGAPFKAPWLVRMIIAPLMKKRFLTKTMSAGFKLPKSAESLIPPSDIDLNEALNKLHRAVNRFKTEVPDKPHPFLGKLTPEEAVQLHLRHAEMHLGFIVEGAGKGEGGDGVGERGS